MGIFKKIIIDKEDINVLKKSDNKMKLLIESVGNIDREYIENPFIALVNSIIYQQISFKAGNSIWNKFENLIEDITPKKIIEIDFESLKSCGLSNNKVNYIKNITNGVINNELNIKEYYKMSEEEIYENLIKIKGIGPWTIEMFLIFSLNKKNIMSYKDLGLRKGLEWLYEIKGDITEKEFNKYKKKFSPLGTLASFYLWEITIRNYFKFENIYKVNLLNNIVYLNSPVGIIEIQSKNGEIISLDFVNEKLYEEKSEEVLENAKLQLNEYFIGKRKKFNLPLRLEGTDFRLKVWKELQNIPYGVTCSYKDIAIKIGNKNASRAIGGANNKNKIAIIIPCHRVIGSNGSLVGYESGIERKKVLLDLEKKFKMEDKMKNTNEINEIKELIEKEEMVLGYFTTIDCNMCKDLFPKIEKMLESFPNIYGFRAESDMNLKIVGEYGIYMVPTIILFIQGKETIRVSRNISIMELSDSIKRYYDMLN